MPHNTLFRLTDSSDIQELFLNAAYLSNADEEHDPITIALSHDPEVKKQIEVVNYSNVHGVLTYTVVDDDLEERSYYVVQDNALHAVWTGVDSVEEQDEDTLAPVAQFDTDVTISFDYTTARGTEKHITGLTPAFVRPSETHAGKNILVGFAPQEDGTFARKTFRTDRITNLVTVAA
jgi:hypothetical protein